MKIDLFCFWQHFLSVEGWKDRAVASLLFYPVLDVVFAEDELLVHMYCKNLSILHRRWLLKHAFIGGMHPLEVQALFNGESCKGLASTLTGDGSKRGARKYWSCPHISVWHSTTITLSDWTLTSTSLHDNNFALYSAAVKWVYTGSLSDTSQSGNYCTIA